MKPVLSWSRAIGRSARPSGRRLACALCLLLVALSISACRQQDEVAEPAGIEPVRVPLPPALPWDAYAGEWALEGVLVNGEPAPAFEWRDGVRIDYYGTQTIAFTAAGEFHGWDGCNDFEGRAVLYPDGTFLFAEHLHYIVGCPEIVERVPPSGTPSTGSDGTPEPRSFRLISRYDSDPFNDALFSAVALERDGDLLELFYPESRENVLVFRLQ
jgi:hypothetical protein